RPRFVRTMSTGVPRRSNAYPRAMSTLPRTAIRITVCPCGTWERRTMREIVTPASTANSAAERPSVTHSQCQPSVSGPRVPRSPTCAATIPMIAMARARSSPGILPASAARRRLAIAGSGHCRQVCRRQDAERPLVVAAEALVSNLRERHSAGPRESGRRFQVVAGDLDEERHDPLMGLFESGPNRQVGTALVGAEDDVIELVNGVPRVALSGVGDGAACGVGLKPAGKQAMPSVKVGKDVSGGAVEVCL